MTNLHGSSSRVRLDLELVRRRLVSTRSQAENYIKLGMVRLNGLVTLKPGQLVSSQDKAELITKEQYVSRGALKLASVVQALDIDFNNKIVLDVGSSTGGFTDYALQHGAKKVIAVDVGTNQLHSSLRGDERIMLLEQTDICNIKKLPLKPDLVLIDVSFTSLRNILPHVSRLASHNSMIIAMVKPQFEAGSDAKHRGVIKNDRLRRQILKDFEFWVQTHFVIINKADSLVRGSKGNVERFYLLAKSK